jgi:lipoate-protein ligase A
MPKALIVNSQIHDPWSNLALEEYLMLQLSQAQFDQTGPAQPDQPVDQVEPSDRLGAILYLWQNQDTVVIGRNQNAWAECKTAQLEAEGGKLARRSTGGGAVFHDLGNLNFSLLLPQANFNLDRNFQMIVDTVRQEGIAAERSGRNDILVDGLKFSGNAFRVNHGVGLHHGTLLVHSEFERVGRYLTVAPAKLAAKGIQSVRSRITNLRVIRPDISVDHLKLAMEKAFLATFCQPAEAWQISRLTDLDFAGEPTLAAIREQFASWDWRYGETLKFDAEIDEKLAWGHVHLGLQVQQGLISQVQIYSDALDCDFIDEIGVCLQGLPFHSEAMAHAILNLVPSSDGFGISRQEMASDLAELLRAQGW